MVFELNIPIITPLIEILSQIITLLTVILLTVAFFIMEYYVFRGYVGAFNFVREKVIPFLSTVEVVARSFSEFKDFIQTGGTPKSSSEKFNKKNDIETNS